MTKPLTHGKISYLFLLVHDFEVMFAFYHHWLGFEVVYAEPGQFAFLQLGGGHGPQIALSAGRTTPISEQSHWFLVIDVAALQAQGVVVGAIEAVPFGRAATFCDPEGNLIELHEPANQTIDR
jgi:predicted enzyme related to lactoylglutathione lyase